jgi:hypothetical protein
MDTDWASLQQSSTARRRFLQMAQKRIGRQAHLVSMGAIAARFLA